MNAHQQILDKWFKEKGWEYWSPLSILARDKDRYTKK